MRESAIGIDLGTYNSAAAIAVSADQVSMLQSQFGPTVQGMVFPSFVKFDAAGEVQVFGEKAKRELTTAPQLVVWGVKRLIGRSYRQVESERKRFLYPIVEGPDGGVVIAIGAGHYTPADISALIMADIKQAAEAAFNPVVVGTVRKAVVTHPAYFDSLQRERTREAAQQAGFSEIELIPEPVAAALAYSIQLDPSRPQYILAVDWGAGTLDIVVVALTLGDQGRPMLDHVRPACGHVQLGGIDMDDALLDCVIEVYGLADLRPLADKLRQGSLLSPADSQLLRNLGDLRLCIEKAKIDLSEKRAMKESAVYQGRPLTIKMARTKRDQLDRDQDWIILEDVLRPHLEQFRRHIEFALQESGLSVGDLDHVLLIGGPMHLPCVRQVIARVFKHNRQVRQELQKIEQTGFPVKPTECVAQGAAMKARGSGPIPPDDELSFDYGLLVRNPWGEAQGRIVLYRGQRVPCEGSLGPLTGHGRPGDWIPVSLYKREVEAEHHVWMGDYRFSPGFDSKGLAVFEGTLRADKDGVISAFWTDSRAKGAPLELGGLNEHRGELMDGPPADIGEVSVDEIVQNMKKRGMTDEEIRSEIQKLIPDEQVSSIPTAKVEAVRRGAQTVLRLAESDLLGHPRLASDHRARAEAQELVANLNTALRHLPRREAGYQEWARVAHGAEALLSPLVRLGAITEDQVRLIRGELGIAAR
jgi:molecular chaperone DnaK (HSP70)